MLFGNSLSVASAATYVGAGSAQSETFPTHTQNTCQPILCHVSTLLRLFIFRAIKENISRNSLSEQDLPLLHVFNTLIYISILVLFSMLIIG